ncbi:MAG: AMP-binding protein [Clostridiales Family XIII bacterium]|nr:AMP-binding protein [Clostridiales Family XIII bacterium]
MNKTNYDESNCYKYVNDQGLPVRVHDIVARSAGLYGDMAAYMVKADRESPYRPITYREFYDDVNYLGAVMTELGLKGKKVALIGENCYQWIVTYVACAAGAGVVAPLGTELRPVEINNLLAAAGAEAIFYTARYDDIVDDLDVTLKIRMNRYEGETNPAGVRTWRGLLAEGKRLPAGIVEAFRTQEVDPYAMFLLMFTSGTTGDPKGAMINSQHIGPNAWDMEQAHNIHPGDITVSILPIYHIFEAVMGQMFMLAHGATICFGDGVKYLRHNMREVGVTVQLLVPLLLENFYKTVWRNAKRDGREDELKRKIDEYRKMRVEHEQRYGKDDDSKLRERAREIFKEEQAEFGGRFDSIFTGAAAIDARFVRGLQDIGVKITQGYGMTEAGPLVSTTPYFSDTYGKAGSVGPSTPSGELAISEPGDDGVGEILWKSPCQMIGYYNMPEETGRALKDGWYYTGDYGFLDENDWLYVTGRKHNIIVTKTGKNIFPEEIEFDLAKHPYIAELMIYGSEDKVKGGRAVSVQIIPDYEAVKEDKGELTDEEMLSLMREIVKDFNETLPNYKRIRIVDIRTTEFVRTATKKLMRQASIDTL